MVDTSGQLPILPQLQPIVSQPSTTPYIIAIVIVFLIAALLIIGILYLRPNVDPVTLMTGIGTVATLVTGQVINFIKASQHDEQSRLIGSSVVYRVNGAMEKLLNERGIRERSEGKLEGIEKEQERVVAKELATAIAQSVPIPGTPQKASNISVPLPVVVVEDRRSSATAPIKVDTVSIDATTANITEKEQHK